jgi:hypothetical protein
MKHSHLLIAAMTIFALTGCDQPQTHSEEVADEINDALDRRPYEETRDVVEDTGDAIEDAAGDMKDALKDPGN